MALLAEHSFEQIGFAMIARRAGLSLAELREQYPSKIAMLAAHMREVDRQVLAGVDDDMEEEEPRERLFDVLMRRLDLHAPHKEAVRSLRNSMTTNPGLALALNGLALRSMQWMLTAADISSSGPRGMLRAQGLAMLYGSALRTWIDDDDPGQARTLAALDRALASGQRWSGLLDSLSRIPEAACRLATSRRRRRSDEGEADVRAA